MLTQKRDRQGAWSSCLALTKVSAEDSEVEQIGSSPSGISAVQEEKKKKKWEAGEAVKGGGRSEANVIFTQPSRGLSLL